MTLSNFKQETTYKHTLGLSEYEIDVYDLPLLTYINEFDYFVIAGEKVSFDDFVYSGSGKTGNVWSYTLHSDGKLNMSTLQYRPYVAIKVFCTVDPITNSDIREIKVVNGHYFGYAVAFDEDNMFEAYDALRGIQCA